MKPTDTFTKVCLLAIVLLLAVIAFRPAPATIVHAAPREIFAAVPANTASETALQNQLNDLRGQGLFVLDVVPKAEAYLILKN